MRRDGRGGSPTAGTDDDPAATNADRRAVASAASTSHATFLGLGRTPDGGLPVRFFTAIAELSGCGHGTVAAQAVWLTRTALSELNGRQHTGGRTFDTVAIRRPAGIEVWFDQVLVALRHPAPDERAAIVAALGLTADDLHPTATDRRARHSTHAGTGPRPVGAAPSPPAPRQADSGVPAVQAPVTIEVEQGDTLGRPASVLAPARRGPAGITTRVGGLAVVRDGQ
ncbi:PhzF family phenazine biosynthesis protein [Streptomyces uncialis]|uniref:PhzF family phenazine biosynthesis protein n=1 Tax=Streptomyces uncialis TaxID=1048205 RepID=UPI002E2FA9ED|nr:PhzF family phenazine biosynthesis protein [Streptomyces uncialis]